MKTVTASAAGLSEVTLELKVAAVQQKVTVESEAEGIQVQQTSSEGEVKAQTLQDAPLINERCLDAIPLLPGVVRGPDGLINIKGARSYQSGLLVNSANATDPVTGECGTLLPAAAGHSRYREFQVTTVWRINETSVVNASYVRSRAEGNLNDHNQFFGNFENPIIRPDEFSLLNFDAPNRFLFWGELRLPWKVMFAPVLEVRDGFPFSLIDANRNFIGPRNRAGRFPVFSSFDIQVFRDFPIPFKGKKRPVRVGIKFFNLFNHFNPRDVQNNVDASFFGGFFNDRGRLIRAKFSVDFLP